MLHVGNEGFNLNESHHHSASSIPPSGPLISCDTHGHEWHPKHERLYWLRPPIIVSPYVPYGTKSRIQNIVYAHPPHDRVKLVILGNIFAWLKHIHLWEYQDCQLQYRKFHVHAQGFFSIFDRNFVKRLPDKGAKILAFIERIKTTIETQSHLDETTQLFEKMALKADTARSRPGDREQELLGAIVNPAVS